MSKEFGELQSRLPNLAEEELLRIATADQGQYTSQAVTLVRDELRRRGIGHVTVERYEALKARREQVEAASSRKPPRWLAWAHPPIRDAGSALRVARQGAVAALVVSGVTTVATIFGAMKVQPFPDLGFNAYALVDAALFVGIAAGIWRGSYVFAVLGLVIYICERAYMWATEGTWPGGLSVILLLAFLNGVRGARALRAYRTPESRATVRPVEPT